ncbi:DUF5348 domain-containing protein [Anaerosinus massiliensis]|uniref:DUF5348 domain-containing protein n=1 Tax=Massilibacillus massiliensis TaxID=1806837 RepID=UPI000DA616D1|nr:DUF5348 domain-containing protein [Massilibacillus massiliensis]
MDKSMQEVHWDVKRVGNTIKTLSNELAEFMDSFSTKNATADERCTLSFFDELLDKLDDASNLIAYYNKPIRKEGRLFKKKNRRYALQEDESIEFFCGSIIEILRDPYNENKFEWFRTKIEAKGGQYYAVGCDEELEGLQVRIR